MKREEFLRQLEYLLQDIPEDDKRDAIDYYRDYLEEAGPEREEEVLREFKSPERIASIIRTDLLGGMEDAGEFTDNGYDDQRFKKPDYPTVDSAGAERKEGERQSRGRGGDGSYKKGSYAKGSRNRNTDGGKWWKYFLIALGVLILGPIAAAILFGVTGTALGTMAGFIMLLLVILLVLALLTAAGILGGVALTVTGIIQLFGNFWIGTMSIGLGLVFTGLGFLLLCCSWLFYGKFLPWTVMGIVGLVKKLLRKDSNAPGGETGI